MSVKYRTRLQNKGELGWWEERQGGVKEVRLLELVRAE